MLAAPMIEPPPPSTESVPRPRYNVQLAVVRTMFPLLAGLLEAGSEVDTIVRSEVATLPNGFVFGMSIFGSPERLRLRVDGSRLVQLDPATAPTPDLDIVFKHLGVAFLVVSFQESTALAFARNRMVVHGDTALAMRMTRCLDRMQAVTLPGPVARRALKAVPEFEFAERAKLVAAYYATAARNAARGRSR